MKVFGIVGWKNSGKTTLVEKLVNEISRRGYSVSTIKHAHHTFDVDHPGKDSHRHRVAGAQEVLLASSVRWALMHEMRGEPEPSLAELLKHLSPVDLVLVEGFKSDIMPKLEVRANASDQETKPEPISDVIALATTGTVANARIPVLDVNDVCAIADFVLSASGLAARRP